MILSNVGMLGMFGDVLMVVAVTGCVIIECMDFLMYVDIIIVVQVDSSFDDFQPK